jgi:hypothetical protein
MEDTTILMFILAGASVILSYVTGNFAQKWVQFKEMLHQAAGMQKEISDLFVALDEALVDDKVSEEEFRKLYDEVTQARTAFGMFLKSIYALIGIAK